MKPIIDRLSLIRVSLVRHLIKVFCSQITWLWILLLWKITFFGIVFNSSYIYSPFFEVDIEKTISMFSTLLSKLFSDPVLTQYLKLLIDFLDKLEFSDITSSCFLVQLQFVSGACLDSSTDRSLGLPSSDPRNYSTFDKYTFENTLALKNTFLKKKLPKIHLTDRSQGLPSTESLSTFWHPTFQKIHLRKIHFWKIHLGKTHLWKIHFRRKKPLTDRSWGFRSSQLLDIQPFCWSPSTNPTSTFHHCTLFLISPPPSTPTAPYCWGQTSSLFVELPPPIHQSAFHQSPIAPFF